MLGTPEEFPFLDAPDARLLNDGYRLLQELGAVDGDRHITRLGRQMAALPVDPRLARVLIESGRTHCVEECLVITAFLSIQDPRERPADKADAADERHAEFADDRSDFMTVLNLWSASRDPAAGGNRTLRHWCHENFLSFLRMREWADLRDQLAGIVQGTLPLGKPAQPVSNSILHQTLLTGFLGGIGVLDEARTYLGARDTRFVIARGTPVQKRHPRWIMAASLIETQRLYARMVAQVQPSWIESAGAHLVKRTYGDAEWDPAKGLAFARETVSLYGRVLSSGRRVNFATVDRGRRASHVHRGGAGAPAARRCRLHSWIATMQPGPASNKSRLACAGETCWRATSRWCASTLNASRRPSRRRAPSSAGGAASKPSARTCSTHPRVFSSHSRYLA